MTAIQTLFERTIEHQAVLPDDLRIQYAGDLGFPLPPDERPYLVANFVSTLDGVVSFDMPGKAGGGPISGANPGDHFIMGLLRASADAVASYRADLFAGRLPVTIEDVKTELRGKDLACWCPLDQPCHADVLLEIANGENL